MCFVGKLAISISVAVLKNIRFGRNRYGHVRLVQL